MRRILTVLILLFAFTGPIAAAESGKFDKALDKKVKDFKKGVTSDKDKGNNGKVRVIIQTTGDPDSTGVSDYVRKNQGRVLNKFGSFPGIAAELPLSALENAASHSAVAR